MAGHADTLLAYGLLIATVMSYLMAPRLFTVQRSDMTTRQTPLLFALAPLAALWRTLVLRPQYFYAMEP
ncbi:hypothetical protein ACFY0N_07210 [Streptomyces vinaceus]|uniref:hypothetical protein n=1 Tax=Streptomyces vinaceus TaxID=1960 RepID=UPI0035DF9CF2